MDGAVPPGKLCEGDHPGGAIVRLGVGARLLALRPAGSREDTPPTSLSFQFPLSFQSPPAPPMGTTAGSREGAWAMQSRGQPSGAQKSRKPCGAEHGPSSPCPLASFSLAGARCLCGRSSQALVMRGNCALALARSPSFPPPLLSHSFSLFLYVEALLVLGCF